MKNPQTQLERKNIEYRQWCDIQKQGTELPSFQDWLLGITFTSKE